MTSEALNFDWGSMAAPFQEFQKIQKSCQEMAEKVTRANISLVTGATSTAMKCMQSPRVSNPKDFLSTQLELVAQQADNVLDYVQELCEIGHEAIKNQSRWTEEKVSGAFKAASKAKRAVESE